MPRGRRFFGRGFWRGGYGSFRRGGSGRGRGRRGYPYPYGGVTAYPYGTAQPYGVPAHPLRIVGVHVVGEPRAIYIGLSL